MRIAGPGLWSVSPCMRPCRRAELLTPRPKPRWPAHAENAKRKGATGRRAPTSAERPTTSPDRSACRRLTGERWCSSLIMTATQTSGVRRDRLDNAVEHRALEALVLVDRSDFGAFERGGRTHVPILAFAFAPVHVGCGPGRRVCDRRHRDRLGSRRRKAGRDDDTGTAARGCHAEQNPEHVHDAILAAKDQVRQRLPVTMRVGPGVERSLRFGDELVRAHRTRGVRLITSPCSSASSHVSIMPSWFVSSP